MPLFTRAKAPNRVLKNRKTPKHFGQGRPAGPTGASGLVPAGNPEAEPRAMCPCVPLTLQAPHESIYYLISQLDHLLSSCIHTILPGGLEGKRGEGEFGAVLGAD